MSKTIATPVGRAAYPSLQEPDTKFNKDGEYRVRLILCPEDEGVEEFLAMLKEKAEEHFEAVRGRLKGRKAETLELHLPFREELDQESEEPTGNYILDFKQPATTKSGKPRRAPLLYDYHTEKRYEGGTLWSGTRLQVSCQPNLWPGLEPFKGAALGKAGLSLSLEGAMIHEARTGAPQSAADLGFTFASKPQAVPTGDDNDTEDTPF